MAAISDVRVDVTPDEVTAALRAGLGRKYHVLAAHRIDEPVLDPRPGTPGTIVVATGSDRFFRAQVTISRDSRQTTLHIKPGWPTRRLARPAPAHQPPNGGPDDP